jgi:hypothetical protein
MHRDPGCRKAVRFRRRSGSLSLSLSLSLCQARRSMVRTDGRHAADTAWAAMSLSIQLSHYGVGGPVPKLPTARPDVRSRRIG